jgi:hypothetical protein
VDAISDLGHIATHIDHSQPDLIVSESVLASAGISSGLDIIGSIVPEISDLASLRIIGAICTQIHRTCHSIAVELVVSDLFIVGLDLAIELEDRDRRIGI